MTRFGPGSTARWILGVAGAMALASCTSEKVVYRSTPAFTTPPTAAANFVGYSQPTTKQTVCGNCHVDQQAKWLQTKHSSAWADLQASGHASAACVACQAGRELDIPVLAWTLPHEVARHVRDATGLCVAGDAGLRIDFELSVRRTTQKYAMRAHYSQSRGAGTQLARLALQGDREWLRWLVPVPGSPAQAGRSR